MSHHQRMQRMLLKSVVVNLFPQTSQLCMHTSGQSSPVQSKMCMCTPAAGLFLHTSPRTRVSYTHIAQLLCCACPVRHGDEAKCTCAVQFAQFVQVHMCCPVCADTGQSEQTQPSTWATPAQFDLGQGELSMCSPVPELCVLSLLWCRTQQRSGL